MLSIKAILATLAAVVVVGGVGTYVFLENSDTENQAIEVANPAISTLEPSKQNKSTQTSEDKSTAKDENLDATAADKDAVVATDSKQEDSSAIPEATVEPTKNWRAPAFDVLRVEPDGSTVIAGQGQPNTTLKVMNGDEVLNEVKIGSTGDFAVIFDEPLGSGDYQLTLKIEDEAGNTLTSEETAIVSIPKDASGQLLAMVTKPGQASRILAQPEALKSATVPNADEADEKVEVAANKETTESNDTEVKAETSVAADASSDEVTIAQEVVKSTDTEATELAEAAKEIMEKPVVGDAVETEKPTLDADKPVEEPVVTAKQEDIASNAPSAAATAADENVEKTVQEAAEKLEKSLVEIAKPKIAEAEMKSDDKEQLADAVQTTEQIAEQATEIVKEVIKEDETQETVVANLADDAVKAVEETLVAKQPEATKPKTEATKPKITSSVRIEAVEVEGDKLFVAGSASKGKTVRILVDGEEVGAVDVNGDGRFLIEARKNLSVGQHMITAALEDRATKEIILRAVVPFDRPEAAAAAAVAAVDTNTNAGEVDDAAENSSSQSETVEVVTDEKANPKKVEIANADKADAVNNAAESKADMKPEEKPSVPENVEMAKPEENTVVTNETAKTERVIKPDAVEEKMVASDETAKGTMEQKQEDVSELAKDESKVVFKDEASEAVNAEKNLNDTKVKVEEEVAMAKVDNDVNTAKVTAKIKTEPKTIVQDSLTPASSQSVIIRKGDTLWQIARRTYGAGVRYTTIYLANQEQIVNPDKIAPGQIFMVPEEALDNAEELHRKRLQGN